MARGPVLHDRTMSVILEAASAVLVERGESASMSEIAEAAGVGRATLYRYFPNREALLKGLADAGLDALSGRIAEARLDAVPVEEGIARLTRSFIAEGSRYAALMQAGKQYIRDTERLESQVAQPVRDLFARGVADGTLRADLPSNILFELYTGLLEKALLLVLRKELGVEPAAAAITSVFLRGASQS